MNSTPEPAASKLSGEAATGGVIAGVVAVGGPIGSYPLSVIKNGSALGENIAQSRVIAKAHYPSDKNFGKIVAEYLYTILLK